MELQERWLSLCTELVRILQMVDPGGVETARPALDAIRHTLSREVVPLGSYRLGR